MPSEAQARVTINKLLEAAGWRFLPDAQGRRENIVCEHRVKKKVFAPNVDLGADFQHAPDGFVDYVLLNTDGRPVAIVEAKKESIDPLTAKEQARAYAAGLGASHIFLSNGLVHYYWNLRQGNPVKMSRFLPLEELGKAAEWRPDSARLAGVAVDENYIAVSQDAKWPKYSAAERVEVAVNKKIRLLRDYQIAAVRALQQAALPGRHRFLFEMATGTGKTLLSAAIAKLYLRTENATRILFLVDRLELENQAWKNFTAYLGPDGISTVIYKQKRDDWKNAQVVVTTIQSLATKNRFQTDFAPTDFQLIISDEAHRTISGNNRAIFEYFVGAKLGLTATPRDYIKGVEEKERQDDPRAYERRLLLDTYCTFGCDDGTPTFRFSLLEAVRAKPEPYLVNPVTLDARTEITTQMLADGYAVKVQADEDGQETELVFEGRDFEKKFFSDETNRSFVGCFLDHAKRDPLTGEIGKTIWFAVSRRHATKLVALLNAEAARRWPAEYGAGSAFAVQVTSDQPGAQQMTLDFANNHLNGRSRWRAAEFRDYETSRTRVCVTVGMMTTGYDCEDVLNVALGRPIFSPTDFIQIKGRGTRRFTFKHGEGAEGREEQKDGFALFDFFANCEFFEEKFDYDRKLSLPKRPPTEAGNEKTGGDGGTSPPSATYTNTSADPMAGLVHESIGVDGMRIDREMYRERFAAQAKAVPALREAVARGDWAGAEALFQHLLANKPEEFWSMPKLREIFRSDRAPTLREILAYVFGLAPEIARREQLAAEYFERMLATQTIDPTRVRELRQLFHACVLDGEVRGLIERGDFPALRARDAALYQSAKAVGAERLRGLLDYIGSSVPLGDFARVA
ncbi:MAG TPA: DEAD/DEAH box helicase family protein [Opitutaceae bacterium]|nr:DEAD/DEAH box helicase family protein [Opitutaceae bacterium]